MEKRNETEAETVARITAEQDENTRMFLAGEIAGPHSGHASPEFKRKRAEFLAKTRSDS